MYDFVKNHPERRKKLKTIEGVPPNNIGEDTRVIIAGSLYFPVISNNSLSFYSQKIVEELSWLLNMAIPRGTTVQSITFFFDNSAQDIPGSEGTLDTSQNDYVIPEVLRELTKVGIRANTAVAVRGPLSAGVPQQTTGGDPDRPSTSKDAPYSELNRIVFTLNNDNIVTYQARFGLASLKPRIKFTNTELEIGHTVTGTKENLIKTIVEHESIETGLKKDLIKVVVTNKPIDERIKENLVEIIVNHKSMDSKLKVALVSATVEDKSDYGALETDSWLEAKPAPDTTENLVRAPVIEVDSSIEAESDSDRSEDEVRRPTNDFALQDNRKDASQYSLYDDFQEALLHGLVEQPATEKVVFANPDRRQTVRMEDTLRLALVSSSYQEWFVLYACLHTEPYEVHQLERAMSSFQSEEAKKRAFATLKRRVEVRSYDIYPLDHTKAGDVATLNALFKNDFENISVFRNLSSVSCSRQRRSADSASCHARRKELANALRLLSGSSTQLNLEDHTDIALLNTSDEGKLWLQAIFTRFRRQEGKAALADTRGMHSVIAMDDTSFTRAQKRIKAGTLNGQPLLLRATPSAGYVLLKPDGRVQSAIAGGDGNRVTLIGRPARLITRALTTLVTDFAPGGRIATLTVSNLANSDQPRGIIALNALKNFMTQSPANGKPLVGELIIEPRSQSIRTFKRMVKDIERLMPKDRPAIDTLVLRSPASGQPEYRLFPGETTVLIPPRPSDSKALRYLPPRASGHTLVPAKLQSATVDSLSIVASKRSEFRQRLLEFGSALSDIKARHSLPDSMVPQLDTLRRDVRGWRMDFMEPDTLARKNIRFTSGALGRFRGFLQKEGRQGMLVKGKKTSTGSLERLRSFIGLYDLMTGIAPIGHHYKNSSPGNMTDTQQQIYIGRQTVFYTAMALQGIEMIDLGRRGIKVIAPAVLPSLPSNKAAPKLPANSGSKLPGGLKKAKGAGKKAARFIPLAGFGVQATSLTLTVIEYETEEDPEVKELLKSRVIFESVDAAVSIISDFAGPFGFMIDGIMHFVRNIFDSHYQRKLNRLNYKKLREVSGKAAQVFDPMHAQLDPGSFLASNQTLNALISGDDKNPLILNIKSINLVNQTLTYGGGYSNRTTFVARSNKDWDSKKCKNVPPMVKITHKCATEVNRIDYSSVPFNLIDDALATLCKKESRLTGYQCENGVFHNLGQMTDKLIILMPSVPEWEARLRYTPFAYDEEKDFPGSSPDSSSPGAQLLDAVSDSKLKRFYRKKVARKQLTKHTVDGSSTISYLYKYLGQMLTGTDGLKFRHSTTSLYLNNKNHIVFFREVDDEFSKLLDYDLYSPKGANNTNVLMSNGGHRIRLHPRGSASTWMLSYDGELPYICITQWEGLSVRCSSELNQSEKTWTLTLGETRFQFPAPTPDVSYRVMAEDVNGLFEWRRDGKVIHRLYDTGGLNDKSSRASKLNRIMSRYTRRASRFLRLELKDCDFSPQIRARCMAGAPEQWLKIWLAPEKPQPWKLNSAFDPPPMGPDRPSRIEQNPAWLQRKQDCDRQVNEYLQKPYRCFPDKLGLPRAQWGQLDRIRLWYDTLHGEEIRLLALSDLQPVQGSPATGYYFFDRDKGRVLFQTAGALNREIKHLHELDASKYGTWFGNSVSKTVRVKDDSQLLVFDAPYYYLLTASPSGQLTHQVIAAETLDDQLSVPPAPSITASNTTPSNQRLIPFRVVDDYANRRLLKTGFYDDDTRTHIAFLSSLLDGEAPSNTDDGSRLRTINEPVRRVLREEHLPVHKVVRGQSVYYIMFSKHSGNLHHFSTDMERPGSVQRLSSGFQLIRPAGENRTVAEIAGQHIFTRVQAHSGSLLADTLSGYRLLIPDKAWDNTRVVSENLSLESGPFKHWQVEATGQMVAKSNDTLSVHQFTPPIWPGDGQPEPGLDSQPGLHQSDL
ncbi:hypothetical protein [Endozoicomonas sp. 8E]|uniref:hypothetical protein n=1 Tax=Endozoicomonas sp. 8E TaxID=3035692 RepID=UPI00293936D3|nr:hypothetical protein [Endozoicomonas sp. 8E]WOG29809.1 hypothetical protein P6910_09165 [Endozoicomonas sp. 8E]